MGRWYLVRHGETEWNRKGKIQGHLDVPLNEHGRRQVKMLAKRLAKCRFSGVYASDLSRTIKTAQIIAEGCEAPIETGSDLREFSFGEWEGLTLEEIETRYPNTFTERMDLGERAFAAPGGEDTAQMLDRVRSYCTRTLKRYDPAENILIVAHGGSIRALLVCLLGMTDDHFWRFRVDRASLSIINNQPNGRVLELWNDTSHLASTI